MPSRVSSTAELRVEVGELRDAAPHASQPRQNRVVAFVERRVAFGAEPLDALRAGQHLAKRRELDVLPGIAGGDRLEAGAFELAQREGDQIEPRLAIPGRAADARELVLRLAHRVERRGRRRHERVEPAEGVDHAEVRGRIEQGLVLVLSVQLDQAIRELLERAGGGERAVDEGAAAPLGGDLAPDEQLFPAVLEDRFDRRGVLAGAHQVARGASPEQQADGFDEDRLAGAGLAGQDVEAGVEFDLDRVNHRKVLNAQEAKHGEASEMARTPMVT